MAVRGRNFAIVDKMAATTTTTDYEGSFIPTIKLRKTTQFLNRATQQTKYTISQFT